MSVEHFEVLIVGAGLSGIGAACHLQRECPGKTYAILEGRDDLGGTWDLFRYPGIRSDSDMYTLGYAFRPWKDAKAIADGAAILDYIRETARDFGVEKHIRFQHRVKRASWCSRTGTWTVEAERGPTREAVRITCNFLQMCSGYYDYEAGYTPQFEGTEQFKGRIVHPQHWPEDLDYTGKRVVIIGSGATAITLVPAMTDKAAHVTMLQRSPTYVISLPAKDAIANWLRQRLPLKLAYGLTRWKNVLFGIVMFWLCRHRPEWIKQRFRRLNRAELGPDYDIDKHFTPRYNPWDQRVCLASDGDLFRAIRSGRASVTTDHIERFTQNGIRLRSGEELEADVVVTATGLSLLALGGVQLNVDGYEVEIGRTMGYKGMMFSGVPNLSATIGYTNASWTLKCDLTSHYVCRLLNYMDRHGYRQCMPRNNDPSVAAEPFIDFNSSYVLRAIDKFPKQGSKAPWRLHQNYVLDILSLKLGSVVDDAMEFSGRNAAPEALPSSAG